MPPEVHARVLAPDFHSATAGGHSFFAAIALDDAVAEYRCFGAPLKERYGADLSLYLLARPQMREELGLASRFAWKLEPMRVQRGEPGQIVWWGHNNKELIGLVMMSQNYFDIYEDDRPEPRGNLIEQHPSELVDIHRTNLSVELNDPVLRGVQQDRVIGLEIGIEWKIADFLLAEE
ncbi:MAG: hypothetical protein GY747_12695 [Planctomycetes bacterium]|nr:hypothetical protein [Planctomycetota bacterium]MCP4772495.1 hypothetical protein [Planctomycetota bacterium]MCP4860904.1 hypothetical protein [Planctomycetota bacterium]